MPPEQQHKNAIDDRDTRHCGREPRLSFMCAVRAPWQTAATKSSQEGKNPR
jgi:hypothetical protein